MKMHPRSEIVRKASAEIPLKVCEMSMNLTDGEFMGIIGHIISVRAKYMVREERHPGEPDTPGDLE